jgi:hypothetical protein
MERTMTTVSTPTQRILLVADYGKDDLAFYEVVQKLQALAGNAKIAVDIVSANAFNVPETALLVAEGVARGYDLVYHNTAPRLDGKPKEGNAGEGLAYIRVKNKQGKEVQVIGVASGNEAVGNSFSAVVRDFEAVTPLRDVRFDETGSQFRSRDAFPQEVIRVLTTPDEHNERLGKTLAVDTLPFTEEEKARKAIEGRVEEAESRSLSIPGNAKSGYITLIAPRHHAAALLAQVHKAYPNAYIDVLPLKSKAPDAQEHEASFLATQLAANAHQPNRTVIALPTDVAVRSFQREEPLLVGTLDSGAHVLSPLPSSFSFANHPVKAGGEGVLKSLIALPWLGALRTADALLAVFPQPDLRSIVATLDTDRIAYVDGYGNVKTSRFFAQHEKTGTHVTVTTPEGAKLTSETVTGTSFQSVRGQTNVARGSSGWGGDGLTEVWIRNGNAAQALGNPEPGSVLGIQGFEPHKQADHNLVPTAKPQQLAV